MINVLVVVDMQKDFVDGALGTKEAVAIVPNVVEKIKNWNGPIFVTYDTHYENYMNTAEGKKLPVEHCVINTDGWQLDAKVDTVLKEKGGNVVDVIKPTFGSVELPKYIKNCAVEKNDNDIAITLIGLCTDICVVSNALMLKANFYENEITVDSKCCAGVTPESHEAALATMRMCQINVV